MRNDIYQGDTKMTNKENGFSIRMIPVMILGILLGFLAAPGLSSAEPEWNVGISGGARGVDGFHVSVGEYYKAPKKEVVVIHDRGIDDEELPVVYFLSRKARVSPGVIVDMRLRGMSWMDITLHYGLGPDIYYVPVTVVEERHGHYYHHYKKHKKHHHWKKIRLEDRDIVDQVNLRFISDHYRCPPERVMQYRSEGRNFRVIDQDFKTVKYSPQKERYVRPAYGNRDVEQRSHHEGDHGHGNKHKDRHHDKGPKHGRH